MSAAEVQRFLRDPLEYVKCTCMNLQTASGAGTAIQEGAFNANQAYSTLYCDLVPWSTSVFSSFATQVMLAPQTAFSPSMIPAYYAPYLAWGTIVSNSQSLVVTDDIPASNPAHNFIFTGGQNGCSLLLLKGTQPATVRALHYPNSDGKKAGYPLLDRIGATAADILLSIDFDLYGEAHNPNACSFFYYDGREWIGVTQPQVQGAVNMTWKRCSMSLNGKPKKVSAKAIGVIP